MLTSMYLQESKGEKDGGVGRTKPCMPTVGYNSEDSEVNVRYARGRRGTALSCLTGCDHSFFLFGFLSSHDIAKASKGEKVSVGHAGTPKVRLPPSYRTMPLEVRY